MASLQTFPIRYGVFRPLLSVLGVGPRFSSVDIDGDHVRVRMGWSFHAQVPLRSIAAAKASTGLVGGIGVHGWRGAVAGNGAASGLVTLEIDLRPGRGYWACRCDYGPCGSVWSRPMACSPS